MKDFLDSKIIHKFQYYLSIIIMISFIVGVFTLFDVDVFRFVFYVLAVQIFISGLRRRFLNTVLEIVLLFFALIFMIPVVFKGAWILGFLIGVILFVFKMLAVIIAVINYITYKSSSHYEKIKIFSSENGWYKYNNIKEETKKIKQEKTKNNKKKYSKSKIVDVEFREK